MISDLLPIFRIRLRTERLELRLPNLDEVAALGEVAAKGIHDPERMPFASPWTDFEPVEQARGVAQWYCNSIASWRSDKWQLAFTVFYEGEPVGLQEIRGENFAESREVDSGSWLGLAHQGKGIGTEMRAAVLHFAFAGLGADFATSASMADNTASEGVSRKLGYQADGIKHLVVRGQRRVDRRWRLTREDWVSNRRYGVEIAGLDGECLAMLGLGESAWQSSWSLR